jgi:hypothetical protein
MGMGADTVDGEERDRGAHEPEEQGHGDEKAHETAYGHCSSLHRVGLGRDANPGFQGARAPGVGDNTTRDVAE